MVSVKPRRPGDFEALYTDPVVALADAPDSGLRIDQPNVPDAHLLMIHRHLTISIEGLDIGANLPLSGPSAPRSSRNLLNH